MTGANLVPRSGAHTPKAELTLGTALTPGSSGFLYHMWKQVWCPLAMENTAVQRENHPPPARTAQVQPPFTFGSMCSPFFQGIHVYPKYFKNELYNTFITWLTTNYTGNIFLFCKLKWLHSMGKQLIKHFRWGNSGVFPKTWFSSQWLEKKGVCCVYDSFLQIETCPST